MTSSTESGSQAPRRPARARDLWLNSRARRIASTWLSVAVVVAVIVPVWGWVRFRISAWEAYRAGQAGARQMIAQGDVQSIWWSDPNGEVFVDPTNGLPAPQGMMWRCVVPDELELERERGYRDELSAALANGITLGPDLRPRLRDRATASVLLESPDAFDIGPTSGRRESLQCERVLDWNAGGGAEHVVLQVRPTAPPSVVVWSQAVATPARGVLVDEGTTLLIRESTGAIQILDLEHITQLAWYGGPFARVVDR